MVYASPSAFLNFPFVKLGLCPEFGATRLVVQRIGWVKAMELFQLGARLPAEEAQAMGLITRVVSVDLGGHVQAVLEQLNQFSPAAVRQTKDGSRSLISNRSWATRTICMLSSQWAEASHWS